VEEAVSVGSLVQLLTFEGGGAKLVEVTLSEDSPAAGKIVAELGVPRDASLVAVVRDGHVVVPRGDTLLSAGDEVLALVTNNADDDLSAILVAPKLV
jgi:trk system potassium uptake protein TrkA